MSRLLGWTLAGVMALGLTTLGHAADAPKGLDQKGKVELKSAGPMAFGPEGVLFVGDYQGATLYAIAVAPAKTDGTDKFQIDGVDGKIATALGAAAADVTINDLAVQPNSGTAFISVAVGRGADAKAAIVTVDSKGTVTPVKLDDVAYAKIEVTKAPEGNQRREAITDVAFTDNRVFMTGRSTDATASTVRVLEFPFKSADTSTGIEIYHGAHGRFETGAPVRTFTPLVFGGEPHLLAAYTCTPLVKLPISELSKGGKVKGTTVAELGNRNQPLDIIAYEKDSKTFLLLANSARGIMKISTDTLETQVGITERVADTAGLKYDTIKELTGVTQLAKLGEAQALVLTKNGSATNLQSVPLP
jgi:hypothetical protein